MSLDPIDELVAAFAAGLARSSDHHETLRTGLAAGRGLLARERYEEAARVWKDVVAIATRIADHRHAALAGEVLGRMQFRTGQKARAAETLEAARLAVDAWEEATDDDSPAELFEEQVCAAARIATSAAMALWPSDPDRCTSLATYATQRIALHLGLEPSPGSGPLTELARAWLLLARMYESANASLAERYARFAIAVAERDPDALDTQRVDGVALSRRLGGLGEAAAEEWRCVLATPDTIAVAHPFRGRIAQARSKVEVVGPVSVLDHVEIEREHEHIARLRRVSRVGR